MLKTEFSNCRPGRASGGVGGAPQRLANLLASAAGGLLVTNLTQERFVLAIAATACAVTAGWLVSLTLNEPPAELERGDRSIDLLVEGVRTLRNRHIDSKNRATVLSLISMVSGLYVALMGLLIGRIGDFSLTYAFAFMGVVVLAGSLFFQVK
jgi:hypothetical protein